MFTGWKSIAGCAAIGAGALVAGPVPADPELGDLAIPRFRVNAARRDDPTAVQVPSGTPGMISLERSLHPASPSPWWWDPWARLGINFPLSIGRSDEVQYGPFYGDLSNIQDDDEDLTDELAEVKRIREQDAANNPGQGSLGVDQACFEKMSQSRKLFLMSLVHPFHGSTALMGLLMSSNHLATLCSFEEWECEGRKILETAPPGSLSFNRETGHTTLADEDFGAAYDLESLLEQYSQYWNLSRQVLFDKSPRLLLNVQAVHEALKSNPLPARMTQAGIERLDTAYIMMWRPFCLRQLSRHDGNATPADAAREELTALERQVGLHRWLVRRELPVLVINLAKLIWHPVTEKHRIKQFLPCLRHLDEDFIPEEGRDIFPGNHWKVTGSVKSFGIAFDPSTVGYDLEHNKCTWPYTFSEHLTGDDLERAYASLDYLSAVS